MTQETQAEQPEQEPFLEGLSKFIKENEEFLTKVFGEWSKQTTRQFLAKIAVIFLIIAMSGALALYGRISGETLAGIIGVVLGYVLGKGILS